ncbi:MAG: hypothetical protein Roseis2KO_35240 [Roseivirga sp.]
MPENIFSPKMREKSIDQLKAIIESKDYTREAKEAAALALRERDKSEFETPDKAPMPKPSGEEQYNNFIKTIRKKRSWGLTPKYSETLQSGLNPQLSIALAVEVFERLQWKVIQYDQEGVIALRPKKNLMSPEDEKISVSLIDQKTIKIESKSTGQEIFDMGRNSVRVKLFIHVFNEIRDLKTEEELSELEKELIRSENWDDYKVPSNLPSPVKIREKKPILFYIIVSISALLISFIFAIVLLQVHLILLFESLIGWLMSTIIVKAAKIADYTDFKSISLLTVFVTLTIIFGSQYFQYQITIYQHPELNTLSFLQFLELRFRQGFTIDSMNLGWYGWIGLFILQFVIIYYMNMVLVFAGLIRYMKDRVPKEVIDFALYHLVKGKNEHGVRTELSTKGWSEKQHQDYVFEAIGAIQEGSNFVKHS